MWLFIVGTPIVGKAEESGNDVLKGFSYTIIAPENQQNKNLGYYDLKMEKNQQQTVQLQLNNTSTKVMTVEIRLNSAKTNNNGVIEYGLNHLEKDPSLKYDFAEIVKGPKKETIPANTSKVIDLNIAMPSTPVEGYIAGGIQLEPTFRDVENTNQKNKVIENRFAFLIGMLLSETEMKSIKPEVKLNKVYPGLADNERNLFVSLSNSRSVFLENMSVDVSIRKNGKEASLFDVHKEDMRMAPNSLMNFPVPLENKRLVKGDYIAQIHITADSGMKWSWSEEFTISESDVALLNAQIIQEPKKTPQIIVQLFILAGISILILVFGILVKRKKNKLS